MHKSELLERIRAGREEIAALWADLTPDEMQRPGMHGGWSVKDVVAHLIFWERRMLEHVPKLLAGFQFPPMELDALNAQVYAENRDRPPDDLLAEFGDLFPAVIVGVEALSDADLARRVGALDGAALWQYVADNTCGHYEEHLPDLRAWVAQLKAERVALPESG